MNPNGSTYPSTFGPVHDPAVVAGWSIDYSGASPNFVAVLADGGYAGGPQRSSYSTNDGQTWTALPSTPPGGSFGGEIAVSTPSNFIFTSSGQSQPYYTTDGGSTWNTISLPGVSGWSGFGAAYYSAARLIAADRVTPNTFYLLLNNGNFYKSTNSGATWTLADAAGLDVSVNPKLETTPGQAGRSLVLVRYCGQSRFSASGLLCWGKLVLQFVPFRRRRLYMDGFQHPISICGRFRRSGSRTHLPSRLYSRLVHRHKLVERHDRYRITNLRGTKWNDVPRRQHDRYRANDQQRRHDDRYRREHQRERGHG